MSYQICGLIGGNTGVVGCGVSEAKTIALGILNKGITPSEYATVAGVKTVLIAADRMSRTLAGKFFPLPLIIDRAKQTVNNTEQTFSGGLKFITAEGVTGWRFGFKTTSAQVKQLRKFNGQVVSLLRQDANRRIWGTFDADNNFIGADATIFFEGLDAPDDATTAGVAYMVVTYLDPVDMYDDNVFIEADFTFQNTLKGLLDVQLFEKLAATANVLHVSGKIATGNLLAPVDIYTDNAATLFNTGALWYAKNLQTGAAISVTGVAQNAAGYGDLTLDATQWGTLSSADKVEVGTVLPTALNAGNVQGIETIPLIYTKP